MVETNDMLIDLINYVGELIKIGEKPVFSLKKYRQLLYREAELKNRIGITHDISTDEEQIWLKIERLQRRDPPPVPHILTEWLSVQRDPFVYPKHKDVVTATILKKDAEAHLENGTLHSEDITEAMKPPGDGEWCDVIFRIENQSEIRQEIEDYISNRWQEWSESEKPRRETIKIYDAFFSLQQSIQTGGAEGALEVVWGIGIALWKHSNEIIDRPVIEQLVEIDIDTKDGTITVRPRSTEPKIAIDPYFALQLPGAEALFAAARNFFDDFPEDKDLSPFLPETFEPVLRQAATHLDKNGQFYPDNRQDPTDRNLPEIDDNLTVTDTWAIFARRRSDNFYRVDLENLKIAVQLAEELPGPSKRLVSEPGDHSLEKREGGVSIGIHARSANGLLQPDDFYFPKPYNKEQISIIHKLEGSDGAVVQGPPGTGKTHTIANIICHYLATGRRVLVTSKGEAALTVLQEHIPSEIRDLTISLLTNEKQGLKQLEKAVGILSNTASQMHEDALRKDIFDFEHRIADIRTQMAAIDSELLHWAEKNLNKIKTGGNRDGLLPMEIAQQVYNNRERHEWFPDRPKSRPTFSDVDIAKIRAARKKLGPDLSYANISIPSISDLPGLAEISSIHQDLSNAANLEKMAKDENLPLMSVTEPNAYERAFGALEAVEGIIEYHHLIKDKPWLCKVYETWRKKGEAAPESKLFNDLIPAMESLTRKRLKILRLAVQAPQEAHQLHGVYVAVEKAAAGKRAFGLLSYGKAHEKELFQIIRVEGRDPISAEDWFKVKELLDYQKEIVSFTSRWNAIANEFDLPEKDPLQDIMGGWIANTLDVINLAKLTFNKHLKSIKKEIPLLFPYGVSASEIIESEQSAEKIKKVLDLNLSKYRLLRSRNSLDVILKRLETCSGPITGEIKKFLHKEIGVPSETANDISDRWQHLSAKLRRLNDFQHEIKIVRGVAASVRAAGAPNWSERLLTEPVRDLRDPWTPLYWRESWNWAIQNEYLRRIDGRQRIQQLSKQRHKLENDLSKTYNKVVQKRTHLGLKKNITPPVEAALVMFSAAIRKIGKGTGIRAHRYRRDAQDAMEKSYSAVPCWIMPSWRVSENLPAIVGSFDLVIIDEASQSDITALPALLRGRKILIVGDDKQVSPTGAFIEERKLLQLKHNYLKNQPFAPLLLPGGSLYDLANAIFPGQRIMLKEHFRCVEPIIRFSMQFYSELIIPLRIPKATERLDPPLIDVHVTYGRKDRQQINYAEAEAIVEEIVKLTESPEYNERSIGVVSLIGAKQAQHIQSLLLGRIGEENFLKHQIVCGDSATFQGKERHIMFVSMVECPLTKSAKTALLYEQRFNVALSRAKDQMYLYRSVTEEMLKPNDLKAKVIQHFNNPMPDKLSDCDDLVELCESNFERDVCRRLLKDGYRVKPQVKVGPYSIDLVIEGSEDRRLAVELDGDKYHTPDRWAKDYLRQRDLERVGWHFWRCWGSSYIMAPDECINDLAETLSSMGIEPIGYGTRSNGIYTEHRVLEKPSVMEDYADIAFREELTEDDTHLIGETIPPDSSQYTGVAQTDEAFMVEVGDRVLIAYNDEPGLRHTIEISASDHNPDMKIIHKNMPLAKALIDAEIHEEVEIPAGGKTRIVTIMGIEKGEKVLSIKANGKSPEPNDSEEAIISKSDFIKVDSQSPPDLSHTKILIGTVDNENVKNWNQFAQKIHEVAFDRFGSLESLEKVSQANIIEGKRSDKGFRYISSINISIQGENANKIWINSLQLARQAHIRIELQIEWRDKSNAAHPGKRTILKCEPKDYIQ